MTNVRYEGREYKLIEEAYFDDICGEPAGVAYAICPNDIANNDGWQKAYRVLWEYHENEDGEDCCEWDAPMIVEPYGEYNAIERQLV